MVQILNATDQLGECYNCTVHDDCVSNVCPVLTYLQSTGTVPARDVDVLLEYVPESDRHLTTDGLLGRGL